MQSIVLAVIVGAVVVNSVLALPMPEAHPGYPQTTPQPTYTPGPTQPGGGNPGNGCPGGNGGNGGNGGGNNGGNGGGNGGNGGGGGGMGPLITADVLNGALNAGLLNGLLSSLGIGGPSAGGLLSGLG